MPLFRRKLSCFYCGHQVSVQALRGVEQHPNGRIRRFTCPYCSADNHLDEDGVITDYTPDAPSSPAPIFARRRPQSPRAIQALTHRTTLKPARSTESPPPPSPTFCRTCLHNQQIVTNAIATYDLPPEDHPDYEEHVNYLYPQRRKELEERWPAVCADCAPKVNDRIRNSNYQAKVASLGQMLARSSGYEAAVGAKRKNMGGGKMYFERGVWWVRGGVWCYFHFLMLAWHGSAVLHPAAAREMDLAVGSWTGCLVRSAVSREVDVYCYNVAARQAAKWIPWSLFGLFWVYRERGLQRHPHKKLVGAKEYLTLECAVYAFRMVSWCCVAPGGRFTFTEELFTRLHLGLFFVSLMSTLVSITCLKLEDPPSFSLREPEPLPGTPSPPASPPQRRAIPRHPMSPITPLRPPTANPPPSTGGSTNYSPIKFRARDISPSPAPRRTQSSPDAMDWNPTPSTWSAPPPPQPSFLQLQRQRPAPAPAPVGVGVGGRENFFSHRLGASSGLQGAEFGKLTGPGYRLGNPQYPPMAPQRFFLDDEATGLESLMGGGLKLDDEPAAVPRVVEEAWWGVVGRVAVLVLAGVAGAAGGLWGCVGAAVSGGVVAAWRGGRGMWVEVVALAGVAAGSVVYKEQGRRAVGAALVCCLGREVWSVLMRLQRGRARAFYEAERKKSLEEEKEGRRRERDSSVGSVSSVGTVNSDRGRGGSAGLERGKVKGDGRIIKRENRNMSFGGLTL